MSREQLDRIIDSDMTDAVERILTDYGVTFDQLMSRNRTNRVATARHLMMALLYWHTHLTLVEIGEIFARDHGTVIHGRDKWLRMLETDQTAKAYLHRIEREQLGVKEPSTLRRDGRRSMTKPFIPSVD